jgi:hypothetical protein
MGWMMNKKLTPYQLDKLSLLIRAINSDKKIKKWFKTLKDLTSNLRMNAIMQITTEMRHQSEDNDLIGAICILCDGEVYNAAIEALESFD